MFLPWFPFPRLRTASSRHQDLYIPPRGIWHTFARRDEDEAYNYGLDREENRFLGEGRVDGVPQLRTGFLSADPSWKILPSSFFLARTHYHTSLTLSFIYFIPDRYREEIISSGETFSNCQFLKKRIEWEFDSQFKYSTSIFVLRSIKLYFTVLYNTNRVFYLHLRKIT